MITLAVSVTSPEWNAVKAYVALRRAELIEEAMSVTASDAERRDAAMRADELAMLVQAPFETREAATAQAASESAHRATY